MSYVRFGADSDVYVYPHVGGGFECCGCRLAEKIKTIATEGCKADPLFGDMEPCGKCNGKGCDACMMHGNFPRLQTRSEAIAHLQDHIKAGHKVPDYAIEGLQQELSEEGEENSPLYEDGYDGPVGINFKDGTVQKLEEIVADISKEGAKQ